MMMLKRTIVLGVLCLSSSVAMAITGTLGVLGKGHGAYVDDTTYSAGPTSSTTNDPGSWAPNIAVFNLGAIRRLYPQQAVSASTEITRLYPYSGEIIWNCTGPVAVNGALSPCFYSGPGQNVFVEYKTPAYGEASVAAYRSAFLTMNIFARINMRYSYNDPITYTEVGVGTADVVASVICSDPNVDGVVFDVFPSFINTPGEFAFYRELGQQFSSTLCKDATHPRGRSFGVMLNPNDVDGGNWLSLAASLIRQGYLIVQGFNLGFGVSVYARELNDRVSKMDEMSKLHNIKYTVAIPAAASNREFSATGSYQPSTPPCDFAASSPGYPQLDYVSAARTNIFATATSYNYYGMDYDGWSQFRGNLSGNKINYPCNPDVAEGVVSYLQQHG